MAKITLEQIKKLREKSGSGIMDCRKALEACKGDMASAEKWLAKKGMARAKKRAERETGQGLVGTYSHHDKSVGALAVVTCETDFVAKTKEFENFVHEVAMQVAATNPKDVKVLMTQAWIRDEKKTVEMLVKETVGKIGENIKVGRIFRVELGK